MTIVPLFTSQLLVDALGTAMASISSNGHFSIAEGVAACARF